MGIQHVSRSGKVYYLHGKPGKSGKPAYYFSTEAEGAFVDVIPAGFEIYENVGGQVFLRRIPKKLITDAEVELTRGALKTHAEEWLHKIDVKKNIITIYETEARDRFAGGLAPWINPAREKAFRMQYACYLAVLRFILTDQARRLFVPERFCFRGSIENWINLGPPEHLAPLLKKYIKHLGQDSFYDLL